MVVWQTYQSCWGGLDGGGFARDVAGVQLPHDGVAPVSLRGPGERGAEVVLSVLACEVVQVGLVALQAEHVPAAERGHELSVLAGAQAGAAGDDAELPAQLLADLGKQLTERGGLALLGADHPLPDAGADRRGRESGAERSERLYRGAIAVVGRLDGARHPLTVNAGPGPLAVETDHPDVKTVVLHHLAGDEIFHLGEEGLLEASRGLLGQETVQRGVARGPAAEPERAPGAQAEIGEEVLRATQAPAADGERGGQAAQQAQVVVDHPGVLPGVLDLPVPRGCRRAAGHAGLVLR